MTAAWEIGFDSLSEDIFSSTYNRNELRAHKAFYSVDIKVFLPSAKRPEREGYISPPSSAMPLQVNAKHINVETTVNIHEHNQIYSLLLPLLGLMLGVNKVKFKMFLCLIT
jgi:hypothetical protein